MQVIMAADTARIFKAPCWRLSTSAVAPVPNRAIVAPRKAKETRHACEIPRKIVRAGKYTCRNRTKEQPLDYLPLFDSGALSCAWRANQSNAVLLGNSRSRTGRQILCHSLP